MVTLETKATEVLVEIQEDGVSSISFVHFD